MVISEVKAALGKRVRFRSAKLHCDGVYILNACIIRRTCSRFFYQAELLDTQAGTNAVVIASLDEVELLNEKED